MAQVAETAVVTTSDGFIVSSNDGTADDLRAELAQPEPAADPAADPADPDASADAGPVKPPKRSRARMIYDREEAERKATAEAERATAAEARAVEAERKAAAAEAAAAARLATPPPVVPPVARVDPPPPAVVARPVASEAFPDLATWQAQEGNTDKTWDDWNDAKQDFRVEQRLARERSQQQFSAVVSAHQARVATLRAAKPDYDTVVSAADALFATRQVPIRGTALEQAILHSAKSAEIIYDLATHPEIAIQLATKYASMPLSAAPVVQDLLESRIGAASSGPAPIPKQTTSAQPVNKPVTGVATTTAVDDGPPSEDAPEREWDRYFARLRKQGLHR